LVYYMCVALKINSGDVIRNEITVECYQLIN